MTTPKKPAKRTSTSKSASEKIKRVIAHLEKAEALLRTMPLKIYRQYKHDITNLAGEVEQVTEKTRTTLKDEIKDHDERLK